MDLIKGVEKAESQKKRVAIWVLASFFRRERGTAYKNDESSET